MIPSVQIFCFDFIRSLCRNIEYLISSKIITNPYQIKKLISELDGFFTQLKLYTRVNLIENNVDKIPVVELYINKFINVSNLILIEGENKSFFTIQVDVPDVIKTVNPIFTEHVKEWILKTLNFSTKISSAGGIERNIFFEGMSKDIRGLGSYTF